MTQPEFAHPLDLVMWMDEAGISHLFRYQDRVVMIPRPPQTELNIPSFVKEAIDRFRPWFLERLKPMPQQLLAVPMKTVNP